METEHVIVSAETPKTEAATPAEVAEIVHGAITEEHIRDTLDNIAEGDREWQTNFQQQMMSLSERVATLETTLLGLAAVTTELEAEVDAVGAEVAELEEPTSDSDVIELPPEPEPEPEPEKKRGFSPLRKLLA